MAQQPETEAIDVALIALAAALSRTDRALRHLPPDPSGTVDRAINAISQARHLITYITAVAKDARACLLRG